MENISILRSDTSERSITFKFTNATDIDKDVYIKDITLYSFLRNIDWVNNVFSWVELRKMSELSNSLVCKLPSDTQVFNQLMIPILCCLRIPPGTYKNTESIISIINDRLGTLGSNYNLAIQGIQAIHNVPACAYDIGDIAILETQTGTQTGPQTNTPWYPAIINSPVILNNFDISLDNTNNNSSTNINCIPVLGYDSNTKALSLPLEGSLNYNNLSLYNSDLISKMGSGSLTSHAISFINGITNTLTIDKIDININDLYASEYGLIRYRENGNDYTEFIINPSNEDLINEITDKHASIKEATNTDPSYSELPTSSTYKVFSCIAYPFFPVSTKLYLYNCNTPYIDKVIESQISMERLFGISLASMEMGSEWTNHQLQTTTQSTPETAARSCGLARETLSTERGAVETLDIVTSVKPITVSVNSIITIPQGSTTSIYVIGDNQLYPLWRSSHTLTYRVIN